MYYLVTVFHCILLHSTALYWIFIVFYLVYCISPHLYCLRCYILLHFTQFVPFPLPLLNFAAVYTLCCMNLLYSIVFQQICNVLLHSNKFPLLYIIYCMKWMYFTKFDCISLYFNAFHCTSIAFYCMFTEFYWISL